MVKLNQSSPLLHLSELGKRIHILGREQAKAFLKAFSKIGWAAKPGIESGLCDITGLPFKQFPGFVQPELL